MKCTGQFIKVIEPVADATLIENENDAITLAVVEESIKSQPDLPEDSRQRVSQASTVQTFSGQDFSDGTIELAASDIESQESEETLGGVIKRKRDEKAIAKGEKQVEKKISILTEEGTDKNQSIPPPLNIDKEGNAFFDLASNNKRRATVKKFKGQIRVDIREFYIDSNAARISGGKGET